MGKNSEGLGKMKDVATHPVQKIAEEVGDLVAKKDRAYGNSLTASEAIMEQLYPKGIPVKAYRQALIVVRVVDKLKRIATDKDAFGEDPWKDVAGYSLRAVQLNKEKKDKRPENECPNCAGRMVMKGDLKWHCLNCDICVPPVSSRKCPNCTIKMVLIGDLVWHCPNCNTCVSPPPAKPKCTACGSVMTGITPVCPVCPGEKW